MNFELFLLYQNPGGCSNHNRCFLREFRWILHGFNTNPKGKAARGAGVPWKKEGKKGRKKKRKNFFISLLIFSETSVIIIQRHTERYSNGKEPHWKCGVPQGIVRSSRILSARVKSEYSLYSDFLYFLENYVELQIYL